VGRIAVTALGGLAWALAVFLVVRLRGTRQAGAHDGPPPGTASRAAWAAGRVAGTVAGALASGLLVFGLGSRFLMRVLAATSPDDVQGATTDADEVVGAVTLGGTVGLFLFAGLAAGVTGMVTYGLLRRWLPAWSLAAGAICGAITAGLLARPSAMLDPENHDFAILEPTWLAVLLCLALLATHALLGAVLMDRWAARWPTPGLSVRGVAALLPIAVLLLVPPVAGALVVVILVRAFWAPGDRSAVAAGMPSAVLRTAVLVAAVAGGVWTMLAAVEILAA
jgi:hypothetical protein